MNSLSAVRAAAVGSACIVVFWAVASPANAAGNTVARATIVEAGGPSRAVTYDPAVVPTGGEMIVAISDAGDGSTTVALDVQGLLPNRGYGAHAHVNPCGATGDDAGPHFQNEVAPAGAAADPAYANPRNEIWLDLRTDANGDGHGETEVPFAFDGRKPRSVVIHDAEMTATDAGNAGTAGGRAACITLP